MTIDGLSDSDVREILQSVHTIAVVGASQNADRPSHYVAQFLQDHGYRIIPVNPALSGQSLLGEKVYATLADIPDAVDMIDIFRAAEYVPGVVDEALALPHLPKVIWMQKGIVSEAAAKTAREAGLKVVMDRCPRIEWPRLFPEAQA